MKKLIPHTVVKNVIIIGKCSCCGAMKGCTINNTHKRAEVIQSSIDADLCIS